MREFLGAVIAALVVAVVFFFGYPIYLIEMAKFKRRQQR